MLYDENGNSTDPDDIRWRKVKKLSLIFFAAFAIGFFVLGFFVLGLVTGPAHSQTISKQYKTTHWVCKTDYEVLRYINGYPAKCLVDYNQWARCLPTTFEVDVVVHIRPDYGYAYRIMICFLPKEKNKILGYTIDVSSKRKVKKK